MFALCCASPTGEEFEVQRTDDVDTDRAGGDIPTSSVLSQSTMEKLAAMPGDLQGVEDGVAEIEELVAGLEGGDMDAASISELKLVMALFDQRASELLLQDNAGLSKEAKDEQRKRLNELFARIETIFNSIRQQQPVLRSVRFGDPAPTSTTRSVPMSTVSSANSAGSVPMSSTGSVPMSSTGSVPAFSMKPPGATAKPRARPAPMSTVASANSAESVPTSSAGSVPTSSTGSVPAFSMKPPGATAKPRARPPAASMKPPVASTKSEVHSERKNFAAAGRQFSMVSDEALKNLANTKSDLDGIEARASELLGALTGPGVDSIDMLTLASMKTELAALETRADRLQCEGIDFIYTGELVSGKDEAKDAKKQQLQRLESLLNQFEEGFDIIKRRQATLRA